MSTERDPYSNAATLAAWCSRSDWGYNIGAWQTALLLRDKAFRVEVAQELLLLDLPADNPAMQQWSRELEQEEIGTVAS